MLTLTFFLFNRGYIDAFPHFNLFFSVVNLLLIGQKLYFSFVLLEAKTEFFHEMTLIVSCFQPFNHFVFENCPYRIVIDNLFLSNFNIFIAVLK
jgi:hypothetical protein